MKFGLVRAFTPQGALQALFVALFFPQAALAFPEMVRHGYVNCASCHVSPSGGGVMSAYGRELSKEVLSTWGREGENKFAYFVESPEWLNLGGDIRTVEVYRDTPRATSARLILMQADLEAAATYKKLTAAVTLGLQEASQVAPDSSRILSRRHYLLYRPSDEISLRAGKFLYAFGLNTPDHVIATRRALQLNDQSMESYNLEAAWLGEQINVFATGILGRPDAPELKRETGAAVQTSYGFAERFKAGVSYLYGSNDDRSRHVVGPYGILGFTPHFFLLTELDFQRTERAATPGASQWGLANYQRLNYEFTQGFHGYLTQELSRLDFQDPGSLTKAYGIGFQFFPRPHFELNLSWQIQTRGDPSEYSEFAWFLFHFYP